MPDPFAVKTVRLSMDICIRTGEKPADTDQGQADMLHLIASLRIKPGTGADVVAAATPCILATRKEEGCLRYEMFIDPMDETNVVFVEEWESRELLGRHIATPHVAAWHQAGKPFIVSEKVEVIYPERTEIL